MRRRLINWFFARLGFVPAAAPAAPAAPPIPAPAAPAAPAGPGLTLGTWQHHFAQFLSNVIGINGTLAELGEFADTARIAIVNTVYEGALAYGLLVLGHIVIAIVGHFAGTDHYKLALGLTALWGILWAIGLVWSAICRGNWAVHGPFLGMGIGTADSKKVATAISRFMTGFFVVALLTNMAFTSIPFQAAPALILLLVSPVPAFFLLRWLAHKEINWATLVPICAIAMYLQVGNLYYIFFENRQPSLLEPMYWIFGALFWLLLSASEHGKGTFKVSTGLAILALGIGLHFGVQDMFYTPQSRLANDLNRVRTNTYKSNADAITRLYEAGDLSAEEAMNLAKEQSAKLAADQAKFRSISSGPALSPATFHQLPAFACGGTLLILGTLLALKGKKGGH